MGQIYLWITFETIPNLPNTLNTNCQSRSRNAYFSAKIANVIAYDVFFIT